MCVPSYKKKRKKKDEQVSDNGSNENQQSKRRVRGPIVSWQDRLDELIAFKHKFGHTNVSNENFNGKYKQLANWVYAQRMYFKLFTAGKKSSSLTKEQINELDALNFVLLKESEQLEKEKAQKLKESLPQPKRKNRKTEAQKLKESKKREEAAEKKKKEIAARKVKRAAEKKKKETQEFVCHLCKKVFSDRGLEYHQQKNVCVRRVVREEEKQSSKTLEGDPEWHPHVTLTATSEFKQDGRGGRDTIANARQNEEGWNTVEFSNEPAATKLLQARPGLREQIATCTIAKCMNADTTDPKYQELYTLIMNVLTLENTNKYHSLLRQVRKKKHANKRKNPQLYAAYDAVDKLLKIKATRAASSFRCDPEKSKRKTNQKKKYLTLEALLFLTEHMDANRLSALFASLSSEESQVFYTIDEVVVATLTVPAGLSIIYTTEIHSGSKTLNPFGVKHFSKSGSDRLLFRIVHEVPDGGFDLTQKDLVAKIIKAYKAIHNLN